MGTTLYLECYSGISGDMTAAALLDLGADPDVLAYSLKSLPVSGFDFKISRVKKAGLDACDFNVILHHDNHDHDMKYLHGNGHCEDVPLHNTHTAHHHEHRSLNDILSIIQKTDMTENARQTASNIFTILGRAEAKAHGTTLENVHFHEAGAIDSIVDIIAVSVCLDNLDITDVIIPVMYEGCGTIRCQHGILPIPVPAVTNIVSSCGLPLHITDSQGEFVTPTGAAIAAAVRTSSHLPEQFRIIRTGLGAGKRNYERPGILRAMLIEPLLIHTNSDKKKDLIYKLETNIDDCSGEALGYVLKRLLDAGAKDVHYFPVYMKKNRPAYQLNVLCQACDIEKMEQIIFTHTTTIGIRMQPMERTLLPRETKTIQTVYGKAEVKICRFNEQNHIYPEYDSVARICTQTDKPYMEIYELLKETCEKQLS